MDPKVPWIKRLFKSGDVRHSGAVEDGQDSRELVDGLRSQLQSQEEELVALRSEKKANFWEEQVKGLAVIGYVFLALFIGFILWVFLWPE